MEVDIRRVIQRDIAGGRQGDASTVGIGSRAVGEPLPRRKDRPTGNDHDRSRKPRSSDIEFPRVGETAVHGNEDSGTAATTGGSMDHAPALRGETSRLKGDEARTSGDRERLIRLENDVTVAEVEGTPLRDVVVLIDHARVRVGSADVVGLAGIERFGASSPPEEERENRETDVEKHLRSIFFPNSMHILLS